MDINKGNLVLRQGLGHSGNSHRNKGAARENIKMFWHTSDISEIFSKGLELHSTQVSEKGTSPQFFLEQNSIFTSTLLDSCATSSIFMLLVPVYWSRAQVPFELPPRHCKVYASRGNQFQFAKHEEMWRSERAKESQLRLSSQAASINESGTKRQSGKKFAPISFSSFIEMFNQIMIGYESLVIQSPWCKSISLRHREAKF